MGLIAFFRGVGAREAGVLDRSSYTDKAALAERFLPSNYLASVSCGPQPPITEQKTNTVRHQQPFQFQFKA